MSPFHFGRDVINRHRIAFELDNEDYAWHDEAEIDLPYDVGGVIRVRDGSEGGSAAASRLPTMAIYGTSDCDPANGQTTDLFPTVSPGTASDTDMQVGMYITALENMDLCAIGFEADIIRDTKLTAFLYESVGETRASSALTYGQIIVDQTGMARHEIPLHHKLEYGQEYDIAVEFYGSGYWPVVNEFDTTVPYTVDGTIEVRRAESRGTASLLIPHLWLNWKDTGTGGFGFDLAKPGVIGPATTLGPIDHGAFITPLSDQNVYGLGILADIPEGSILFARVYKADQVTNDRLFLLSEGSIYTAGEGMRWHDVPLALEWQQTNYNISIVCTSPGTYEYWDDSSGLPYDAYGAIQVRDGDHGGWAGSSTLVHMRVHACDDVLTDVEDRPPRFSSMFINPAAPNPADGIVTFEYSVDAPGAADLEIYDVLGRRVATVFSDRATVEGLATAGFDTSMLSSGVYFVKLRTNTKAVSRKFVVTH
jgi:hypothetical protein